MTFVVAGVNLHPKGIIKLSRRLPNERESYSQRAMREAEQERDALIAEAHSKYASIKALTTVSGAGRPIFGLGLIKSSHDHYKPDPQYTLISAADIGALIQRARKRMKMTQQQFADAAGVGRRFLSELENGKPSLEFDKVLACALAAGIDIFAKPRLPL